MKLSGTIIKSLLPVVSFILLSGCIKEDLPACGELQSVVVQMSLDTKADGVTYANLTEKEAEIKTLRVYAFVNGQSAGHKLLDGSSLIVNGDEKHFLMDLSMYSFDSQEVDFYAVANEGSINVTLTEELSQTALETLTFSTINGVSDNSFPNGMPAVDKVTLTLDMSKKSAVDPGTIDPSHSGHVMIEDKVAFTLKRPVGKMRVFAAKAKGVEEMMTIESVVMRSTGTRMRNYLMPQTMDVLQKLNPDLAPAIPLDLASAAASVAEYTGVTTGDAATIASARLNPENYTNILSQNYYPYENPFGSPVDEWDTPRYYNPAYVEVPESEGAIMGNVLDITYKFGTETSHTGTVYLPPIERNNQYDILCLMNNDGIITITYTVADWNQEQENWVLDYNYPDYTDIYPKEIENGKYKYPENGPKVRMDKDFVALFKFYGPEGGQWSPVHETDNSAGTSAMAEHYVVSVWLDNEEVYNSKTNIVTLGPSMHEYEIRVKAEHPENIGAKVKLGISFIPAWTQNERMLLLINGGNTAENTSWGVNSGTDPLWIEIEQIELQNQ